MWKLIAQVALFCVVTQASGQGGPNLFVEDVKYCGLYADVALTAASFARRVKSHAELKDGVDPIYVFSGPGQGISDRIVMIAWRMKPNPRDWAMQLMRTCHATGGDLRRFLAEPT